MEKLVFHQISDSTYVGMITILDYEISLKKCLLDITIPPEINNRLLFLNAASSFLQTFQIFD